MTGDFDHVGRAQPPSWLQGQQPLSHSSDLGLSELGGLNGVPERQGVEQLRAKESGSRLGEGVAGGLLVSRLEWRVMHAQQGIE